MEHPKHPPPPTLPQEHRMGPPALYELRQEVAELLGRRDKRGFPGSQPVSFGRRHLEQLRKRDYYVCEKSDGIRCMMYLTAEITGPGGSEGGGGGGGDGGPEETAYMIDRKNDYYQVKKLHIPRSMDDPSAYYTNTLLDGELVNDREEDGRIQMRYLVFDCLVCDGKLLTDRTLDKRLAYFRELVWKPYYELFFKRFPDERQWQPFLIEMKEMEFGYASEKLFLDTLPSLRHGNDGLIFTSRASPYQHGTDPNTLKWKPSEENSIDFKLHLDIPLYHPSGEDGEHNDGSGGGDPFPDYEAMPRFAISVNGDGDRDVPYGEMFLTQPEWEEMRARDEPLDCRIVECRLDEEKRWRFMRFRDDKKGANHISTVESVIDSIREPVSKEDLISSAGEVRKAWKARNAPGGGKPT